MRHGPALLAICLLLAVGTAHAQRDASAQLRRQRLNDANALVQRGDFRGAVAQLQALVDEGPATDTAPLLQLLDLQVRLKDEAGARASAARLLALLPASGPFGGYREMDLAGRTAASLHRLGDGESAEALWRRMRDPAPAPNLAMALFNSYRQAGKFDECVELARTQRASSHDPALWSLDLANLLQERGDCRGAFGELRLWRAAHDGGSGALVSRQLLGLAEACDDAGFEDWMAERAQRFGEDESSMGEDVLDALVQRGRADRAVPLAWTLDRDGSGRLPYGLARTLLQDGRWDEALPVLEGLEQRKRPAAESEEFRLLSARAKAGLGRAEEALADYRQLEGRGQLAGEARLEAARLLLGPLERPAEADDELVPLLRQAPAHREALPLAVLLEGALGRDEDARQRLETARGARPAADMLPELDYLAVRLDWWAGRLSKAGQGLGGFLERQVRHDRFNDAVELLDLLAFATSDSAAVVAAGEADRLAFLGRASEALARLETAIAAGGPAAEVLGWQACRLAETQLPPAEGRRVLAAYRTRQPDSIRLDRVAWMDFSLMERQGLPADSLRAAGLALLETWPESLLQDAVRRRLRDLEGGR